MRTELLDKVSSSPLYPYHFTYLMGGESIILITPRRRIKLYGGSEIFTVEIPASHWELLWAPALGYFERLSMVCYEMYLFMFVSLYISYVSVSKPVDEKK